MSILSLRSFFIGILATITMDVPVFLLGRQTPQQVLESIVNEVFRYSRMVHPTRKI
jgi:hypothetical protein